MDVIGPSDSMVCCHRLYNIWSLLMWNSSSTPGDNRAIFILCHDPYTCWWGITNRGHITINFDYIFFRWLPLNNAFGGLELKKGCYAWWYSSNLQQKKQQQLDPLLSPRHHLIMIMPNAPTSTHKYFKIFLGCSSPNVWNPVSNIWTIWM